MTRFALAASLVTLAASASPAAASVTVGQLAPGNPPVTACSSNRDYVMPQVVSGNSYVVPGTGVITSWSHKAAAGGGQMLGLKVLRHLGGAEFLVLAHNGPRALAGGMLNTFPVSIPVSAGDIVGLNTGPGGAPPTACEFDGPNYEFLDVGGPFAPGQVGTYSTGGGGPFYALNISAVFQPTNSFTLGKVRRNTKKGIAIVVLNVPNAGDVTVSGKGVKGTSAGARIAKAVSPGTARVKIKAKGRQKRTLDATGKVTVKSTITYTPTGGDPSRQRVKVKLKKKL